MNEDVEGSQGMDDSLSTAYHPNRGGWRTFPFFIVMTMGMTLASGGLMANMIVYLIQEYNVKKIDAIQITNLITGFICLLPVLGAIIADAFLGCFPVIWISSFISFLGTLMVFITTILDSSSTSQQCESGSPNLCKTPSKSQFAVLYIGIALATLGRGGTRTTLSTMGADQFDKPKDQSIFFNWYFFAWYVAVITATTAFVYVEDNVSWSWGFGLSVGTNLLALAIFLLGSRFYRHIKAKGSPFTEIARVVIVTIRKRKALLSMNKEDYYYGEEVEESNKMVVSTPTNSLRFLNRAALRKDGDTNSEGSIIKTWNLCKVQEVEDVKILIKILPLWCSSTFLYIPSTILISLSIIQALTMDRHVGPKFKIPAASIQVFCYLSSAICLTVIDRAIQPVWQYFIGRPLTHLQRIGIGHILNITSVTLAAIVESRRLSIAHSKQSGSVVVPMSVLWLVPQLVAVGLGEAFHFPGQTALFYQEFPKSLKNMATAVISLIIAISYYLSIPLIDLIRNVTKWLPDDLNQGRLDLVYWVIVVIGVMNFGYYLLCASLYKYREITMNPDDNSTST